MRKKNSKQEPHGTDCPLCLAYEESCDECPINLFTENDGCNRGIPFWEARDLWIDRMNGPSNYKEWLKANAKMIRFLKKILQKIENKEL